MWKTHSRSCPTKVHYGEGIMDEAGFDNAATLQNTLVSERQQASTTAVLQPAAAPPLPEGPRPRQLVWLEGVLTTLSPFEVLVTALQGSIKSYSAADMCASPAQDYKYAPLILHDVVLSSLVRSACTS